MPAFENDVLRVSAEGGNSDASQMYVNIFHWRIITLVDGTDATVGAEVKTFMDTTLTTLLSILNTNVGFTNYSIVNVTQDVILDDEVTVLTGSDASTSISSQVAALVLGRTATVRVQGRKYIGGMGEAQVDSGGKIGGAAIIVLQNFADEYINTHLGASGNEYEGGTYRPEIISPPAPPVFTPFIGRKVMTNTRTQRSRTQRVVLP